MSRTFDEGLKCGLVSLAAESRETALRVDTRPAGDAVAVRIVRVCTLYNS